jgi:Flp pilus assembly secretin CpaC
MPLYSGLKPALILMAGKSRRAIMRFSIALFILAAGLAGSVQMRPCSAADNAPLLAVGVDRVINIRLWGPASTVIVGNPAIADVNLINGRSLIITGHRVGQTSIMVLDSGGRELLHQTLAVGAADSGQVAIQRGGEATDYSCSPRCERLGAVGGSPGSAAPTTSSAPVP